MEQRTARRERFSLGARGGAGVSVFVLALGLSVSSGARAQEAASGKAVRAEAGESKTGEAPAAPAPSEGESSEQSAAGDDEGAGEAESKEDAAEGDGTSETQAAASGKASAAKEPPSTEQASDKSAPDDDAVSHPTSVEEDDSWLAWPFSSSAEDVEPGQRWAGVGGFVGWVHRPSKESSIDYRPGIAYGGYLRPEVTSWLGLRLFYREERLPVSVGPGAFDTEDDSFDFDFKQPDIEVINLGARLEPTWVVHPRFRLRAIAGWSWLRMSAGVPKAEDFQMKRTFRAAVQTEISLGAGLSVDIIQDWLDVGVDVARSFPGSQTGDAYEPQQVIVDGEIRHIARLPRLRAGTDVIFSLGLVL